MSFLDTEHTSHLKQLLSITMVFQTAEPNYIYSQHYDWITFDKEIIKIAHIVSLYFYFLSLVALLTIMNRENYFTNIFSFFWAESQLPFFYKPAATLPYAPFPTFRLQFFSRLICIFIHFPWCYLVRYMTPRTFDIHFDVLKHSEAVWVILLISFLKLSIDYTIICWDEATAWITALVEVLQETHLRFKINLSRRVLNCVNRLTRMYIFSCRNISV